MALREIVVLDRPAQGLLQLQAGGDPCNTTVIDVRSGCKIYALGDLGIFESEVQTDEQTRHAHNRIINCVNDPNSFSDEAWLHELRDVDGVQGV